MKKKVLIIALSLLASAGMTHSTKEVGNFEVAGNSSGKTYVIFSTDRYNEQGNVCEHLGTFLQGRLLEHKEGFSRRNYVTIGEDPVIVGRVLWCKEMSEIDEGASLCASDLFGEVEDSENGVEEVLGYLAEGIGIATPEEQELEAYQGGLSIELFAKLHELHDYTEIDLG